MLSKPIREDGEWDINNTSLTIMILHAIASGFVGGLNGCVAFLKSLGYDIFNIFTFGHLSTIIGMYV